MNRLVYRWMCGGFTASTIIGIVWLYLFPSRLMGLAVCAVAFTAAETGWRGR